MDQRVDLAKLPKLPRTAFGHQPDSAIEAGGRVRVAAIPQNQRTAAGYHPRILQSYPHWLERASISGIQRLTSPVRTRNFRIKEAEEVAVRKKRGHIRATRPLPRSRARTTG